MSIFDKEIDIPINIESLKSIGFQRYSQNNVYIKHINIIVNGVVYRIYKAKVFAYLNSDSTWDFEVQYEFEYIKNNFFRLNNIYDVEVLVESTKQHIIKKSIVRIEKFQ